MSITPSKIQGTTLSASLKSAMISLIFSIPTDTCIKRHAVTTIDSMSCAKIENDEPG